jgi:hypothetical protein
MVRKPKAKEKKLLPKNLKHLLSKYIQLKTGDNMTAIADKLGVSYHSLIKTIQKLPNRGSLEIRTALALYLDVPYEDLWGPQSDNKIKDLIKKEIIRITVLHALEAYQEIFYQIFGTDN